MGVWRRTLVGIMAVCGLASSSSAQSDSCDLQYHAFSGANPATVSDQTGSLGLGYNVEASESLSPADSLDQVIPPFAPPGGWFVALSNPDDTGTYWARTDSRVLDPAPGTETTFQIRLHPRYSETSIDSVSLDWSGPCFTPPNVTVLSMTSCDSTTLLVQDMTAVGSVGFGRGSGDVWDDDAMCLSIVAKDDLVASVTLFLEGPYASGKMSVPSLYSDELPLSQPYDDGFFDATTLDYDVAQTVVALPDSAVDWVLVELRTAELAATTIESSRHAAVLLESGRVVEADGSRLRFPGVAPDGYRVVARHRNHLDVISADTLDLSDGVGAWDFTTAMTQAHSDGGAPMASLGDGSFGLFAGDASADKQVTAPDFNIWNASTTAGETGYQNSDLNMDGLVTAPDFNLWNANTTAGASSQVPD